MTPAGKVDRSPSLDFIDYSADILRNLQKMAEDNGLVRYAHLIGLAVMEAKYLGSDISPVGGAAVISIDEKRPRGRNPK